MQKIKNITKITTKDGADWSVTSKSVYESILKSAPLFKKLQTDEGDALKNNISGELQFLEFAEMIFSRLDFDPERELLHDNKTGESYWEANEVELVLCKKIVLAIGSIAEAICYVLVTSNGVKLRKSADFIKIIKIATDNNLIDDFESNVLHEVRKLRNFVHLKNRVNYDSELFSQEEFDTAKCCLYWLLLRLLKIDKRIMSIHFPFLPKCSKEALNIRF